MSRSHDLVLPLILAALSFFVLPGCSCNDTEVDDDDSAGAEPITPAPNYNRGFYLDMDVSPDGSTWMAYQDRDGTTLNVAQGTGTPLALNHWVVDGQGEVVGGLLMNNYHAGNYATVSVDSAGIPHIAHWDRDSDTLRYAKQDGSTWLKESIDSSGGTFASMAILQDGRPIVAYQAGTSLKAAVRTDGVWTTEVIDAGTAGPENDEGDTPAANVGSYADLLVGTDGTAHIAYYDAAHGDLRVASGAPGDWSTDSWATEGDVGQWPCLSEYEGHLYVAYLDATNKDLLWGRWTGSQLTSELVDNGDFVGADSAVAWVGETAVIVYHDGVNNDARLAVATSGGWELSTLAGDGAHGFYNNLATNGAGGLTWAALNHTTTDIVVEHIDLPE